MNIVVVSLFPQSIREYFKESILGRAIQKGIVSISYSNPRDFACDSHKTVDSPPYGGGFGMVMQVPQIVQGLNDAKSKCNPKSQCVTILTSASGVPFTQKHARMLSKKQNLIIIAGHYEGIDERISSYVDYSFSIGDYILTGGELAVGVIIDSVVRLIPGVIKKESYQKESFQKVRVLDLVSVLGALPELVRLKRKTVYLLEYPQYTSPRIFENKKVPRILLSGNHKKIYEWRIKKSYELTKKIRPDLLV